MKKLKKEVGLKIRRIRHVRGLTQEQLGEKIGMSYKFIGEIERGAANPSLDSLASIASALRINVKDFFPAEGDLFLQLNREDLITVKKGTAILYNHFNQRCKKNK